MFNIEELDLKGAWQIQSPIYEDHRGLFRDWFKQDEIKKKTGMEFSVVQASFSLSKKHVARGIHTNRIGYKQRKIVNLVSGSIWDVIIDLRPNSPTFTKWISLELNAHDGKSLLLSEGLGHAFLTREEDTVVSYGFSAIYSQSEEIVINVQDPDINIEWPTTELIISSRDSTAPLLREVGL